MVHSGSQVTRLRGSQWLTGDEVASLSSSMCVIGVYCVVM